MRRITLSFRAIWKQIKARAHQFNNWLRRHVPIGIRTVLGLLLILFGIFGFLPILGFWMLPLGVLIVYSDIRDILRYLRRSDRDR